MYKFYIKTFGCQMNKNDSDVIQEILIEENYLPAERIEESDIVLVNTCSVRNHAEQRALGYISTLKKWREKKGKALGVVGCMAKRLAGEIISKYPFVDFILGPDSYRKIPRYLGSIIQGQTKIIDTEVGNELYTGICRKSKKVSDFVSITRGCNNFCSYCIVPFVRGGLRSRPVEDILKEVNELVSSGVKDITLLGQNVNEYHYQGVDFPKLLEIVARETGIFRLRFLTSHPKDFDEEIIRVIKENKNICEWFHLPLQSGSDRILRLMNRKYSKADYLIKIEKIKKNIPDATITTDIIVGFPTETEDEFNETIELIKSIEFDDAYMYRYSYRPGTKAGEYPSLPEDVIKERLKILIEIQSQIIKKKTEQMIGRTYEVLFEEKAENGTRGKTRGNKDVIVTQKLRIGSVYKVLITGVRGRTPIGEIV
ncbi:MAG: tRNA (N6-isopentenyl adenosine(37)-C2)-methylthiotransferase MiaB [candidate division WOR-3 bacterium]|nr:tRNA (N6-isopentenyl adenosine(37)-C2)-methylthiotransferase MiaB [candidate division WOR-3 bacterium]